MKEPRTQGGPGLNVTVAASLPKQFVNNNPSLERSQKLALGEINSLITIQFPAFLSGTSDVSFVRRTRARAIFIS
jgi:hypothetical protein